LASLLPGLREARAPLISGYLWLLALWLAFGTSLPGRDSNPTYGHFWEVLDAIGPLGTAIAVSIAAYLLGSLVFSAVRNLTMAIYMRYHVRREFRRHRNFPFESNKAGIRNGEWISIGKLEALVMADGGVTDFFPAPRDRKYRFSLEDLISRSLEDARRQVKVALWRAVADHGDRAMVRFTFRDYRAVEIPQPERGLTIFAIPQAPLPDFNLAQNRLVEISERLGLKIEQISAEAEFREAVAFPLIALVGVLSLQVGLGWLIALAVPAALLVQRRGLYRRATWELLEVLSARAGTPGLDRVTPIFARCRKQMEDIAEAIEHADWSLVPPEANGRPQ
jgi:hypothetical protein